MVDTMTQQASKLQINWVCLACTAGAPICFHAVPTICERDCIVAGEYMNKEDRNVWRTIGVKNQSFQFNIINAI